MTTNLPSAEFGKSLFNNHFSHIYIEREARTYALTESLLKKFPNAETVAIGNYKSVFNRPNQDFQLQKRSMKLVLAVKKDNYLYEGSDFSQSMGHKHFYYNSLILNCVYNCDYCYLQGMYPSGNIVVFVNIVDFFDAVSEKLKKHAVYLAISYDTDLLAFENVVPYCSDWIDFARGHKDLTMEIRTKSMNYKAIRDYTPAANVILAWTVSPDIVAAQHEKGAPSLEQRLSAALQAARDGWNVRLCFDPIVMIPQWQTYYEGCIRRALSTIPADKIYDVSVGVFRMNAEYWQRIKKQRGDSAILHHPFSLKNKSVSYSEKEEQSIYEFVSKILLEYLPKDRIYI
jgi:spore photoproduct lyase